MTLNDLNTGTITVSGTTPVVGTGLIADPGYYYSTSYPYNVSFKISSMKDLENLIKMQEDTKDDMIKTKLKELILCVLDAMHPEENK